MRTVSSGNMPRLAIPYYLLSPICHKDSSDFRYYLCKRDGAGVGVLLEGNKLHFSYRAMHLGFAPLGV